MFDFGGDETVLYLDSNGGFHNCLSELIKLYTDTQNLHRAVSKLCLKVAFSKFENCELIFVAY